MEKKRKTKILRDMRNLLLFILLSASSVWGNSIYSQEVRLTLEMKNVTLEQVFERIRQQSQFEFIYNTNAVDGKEQVSVSLQNGTISEILDEVLGSKYAYTIKDKYILIRQKHAAAPQQQVVIKEIKGKVMDKGGNPLPGVTVVIKGSDKGVSTDEKGEFMLLIIKGMKPTLRFSFIGMTPVEVVWTDDMHNVVMEEDVTMLEEATVTTGYQTINKQRMTGAVEAITAKNIENKGYASVGDILRGALAGVSTRNTSGKPGVYPEIRVRGLNSLYGDMNPIWVVDGVPFAGNLNDIDPEEIESITVLKDAAATAIYGSQAANGVIVVKRKRGKEGTATIRISSNFSIDVAPKNKLDLMSTEEKIAFERSIYEDFPNLTSGGRVFTLLKWADVGKISKAEAEAEIARLSKINTNWYDVILETAFSHNHSVSLSGGTEKTHYYASLNYRRTEGIIPTNTFTNWGGSIRLSHKFNNHLNINFDLSSTMRKDRDSDGAVSPLRYATYANPYERPYDENGNLDYDRSNSSIQSSLKDGYAYDFNILDEMRRNTSTTNAIDNMVSLGLEIDIVPGLRLASQGTVYNNTSNVERILDPGSYTNKTSAWIGSVGSYSELPDELNNGTLSETDGRSLGWTWRNNIELKKSFKDMHFVNVYLGHEVSERKTWSNYSMYPEYDPEKGLTGVPEVMGLEDMKSHIQRLLEGLSEYQNRNVSFFMSASYSFGDRYVVSGSARLDGSDIIGEANRFSPLWNASFKYNLHRENFMKNIKWLDETGIRFSYGYTGSIDKNALPFAVMTYMSTDKYYGIRIPTFIEPKNPSVKWQKKQDRSLGFDLAFLKYRIKATVNYYNNVTRDLLDQKTLPISVGVSSVKCNTSSVRNYGWELSLATRNIQYKDFSWTTSLNMSANKSKVLESYYKSIEDVPPGYDKTEPIEGEDTNAWFGYRFAGIDPRTGHTLAFVDNSNRAEPIGFQRPDGQWVIDMDDENQIDKENIKENLGKSYPTISGGFSTAFRWKQLTLDANFSFMAGHKITAAYYASASGGSVSAAAQNVLRKEASRWRKPGDVTEVPAYSTDAYPSLRSDWYDLKLEDGAFVKCTSISLGYHIPSKVCKKVMLNSCRVNLNVRDVFTITKYSGIDPENFGGFGYPNPRKYMLSLSIGI